MAANPELRMDQLPSDTLLHVLSFLSFRDLIRYVPEPVPEPVPRDPERTVTRKL